MSKGSKPRPMTVSYREYVDKWEKVFGDKTKKDRVDEVLKEVVERAAESVYIPKGRDIKEIVKNIENNKIHLLNDNTLEVEIAKMKMES